MLLANLALYFIFRPISLTQLISLTTIDTCSWLSGLALTHQTAVREAPSSIPGSGEDFYVCFVVVFYCLSKPHYLLWNFAVPVAMLIHKVYLRTAKFVNNKGIKVQKKHLQTTILVEQRTHISWSFMRTPSNLL